MSSERPIRRLGPPLLILLGALGLLVGASVVGGVALWILGPVADHGRFSGLAILSSLGAVSLSCGIFLWSRGFEPGPGGFSLRKLLVFLAGLAIALAAVDILRFSLRVWFGLGGLQTSDVPPAVSDMEAGARFLTATLRLHLAVVAAGALLLGVAGWLRRGVTTLPAPRRVLPLLTRLSGIGAGLFLAVPNVLLLTISFLPRDVAPTPASIFPWLRLCVLSLALGGVSLGASGIFIALSPFAGTGVPQDDAGPDRWVSR